MLQCFIYELQADGTETLVCTRTVQNFGEFLKLMEKENWKIGKVKNPKFQYRWIYENGKFKMF